MGIYQGSFEGIEGLLIYKIADSEYCSDIFNIIGVLRKEDIFLSRNENNFIQAIFNNLSYQIIDLHRTYEINSIKESDEVRILLHEIFGKRFCFFVDHVIEIISTDSIFVEKSLDLIPYSGQKPIKYILKYQNRDIFIPDFEVITKRM